MAAAMEGKLTTVVIRTPIDDFGRPMQPRPEFSGNSTGDTRQLAKTLQKQLPAKAAQLFSETTGWHKTKLMARKLGPIGTAVDVGIRAADARETEQQFAAGEMTSDMREEQHVRNAAGFAGGWGGAAAGGCAFGKLGVVGGAFFGPAGASIGGGLGMLGGGIAGYYVGEKATEEAAAVIVQEVQNGGERAVQALDAMCEESVGAWGWTRDTAKEGWVKTCATTDHVVTQMKVTTEGGWTKARDATGKAWDSTQAATFDTWGATKEKTHDAYDWSAQRTANALIKASQLAQQAADAIRPKPKCIIICGFPPPQPTKADRAKAWIVRAWRSGVL